MIWLGKGIAISDNYISLFYFLTCLRYIFEVNLWIFFSSIQAHYSTGAVASSFTSTAQVPVTQQEAGMKSPVLEQLQQFYI